MCVGVMCVLCFYCSPHHSLTPPPQVCVLESKAPQPLSGTVDSALQVIVTQPSPCPTPAPSPQIPANIANQSQVRMKPRPLCGPESVPHMYVYLLSLFFFSQNPPAPPLSDPPQIYLTSIGDPSSLTPLIPLGPVGGSVSPVPPPHMPMGPQGAQQDDCGGVTSPGAFSSHPHPASHPTHPSPVFVIINPPPLQQQQPAAMASAPPAAAPPPPPPPPAIVSSPPSRPPPPPIVIKEENLPSEEELLEMVSLEEKQMEEVRGGGALRGKNGSVLVSAESTHLSLTLSLPQVPQLICGPAEPETPLTIVESPPPACMEPGVGGQQPANTGECKDTPTGNRKWLIKAVQSY